MGLPGNGASEKLAKETRVGTSRVRAVFPVGVCVHCQGIVEIVRRREGEKEVLGAFQVSEYFHCSFVVFNSRFFEELGERADCVGNVGPCVGADEVEGSDERAIVDL